MKIITRSHAVAKSRNTRYYRESAHRQGKTLSRCFSTLYSYTRANAYNRKSNCWEDYGWCSDSGFPFSQDD